MKARRFRLSDLAMDLVRREIDRSTSPDKAAVTAVLRMGFGDEVWEEASAERPLNPTLIEIPEDQWRRIAQLVVDRGTALGLSNAGLTWMNQGPSAYQEEATTDADVP